MRNVEGSSNFRAFVNHRIYSQNYSRLNNLENWIIFPNGSIELKWGPTKCYEPKKSWVITLYAKQDSVICFTSSRQSENRIKRNTLTIKANNLFKLSVTKIMQTAVWCLTNGLNFGLKRPKRDQNTEWGRIFLLHPIYWKLLAVSAGRSKTEKVWGFISLTWLN